jgi:hypothetical protein
MAPMSSATPFFFEIFAAAMPPMFSSRYDTAAAIFAFAADAFDERFSNACRFYATPPRYTRFSHFVLRCAFFDATLLSFAMHAIFHQRHFAALPPPPPLAAAAASLLMPPPIRRQFADRDAAFAAAAADAASAMFFSAAADAGIAS